jgi:hypothetical protein
LTIKKWQLANKEQLKETNKINGAKSAAKVLKKIVVEKEDGTVLHFNSKSEFQRQTGQWANTVLKNQKMENSTMAIKLRKCDGLI